MGIEFVLSSKDIRDALKKLFASTPKGRKAEVEFFDFSAKDGEMTLEGQGFSYVCPAEVVAAGIARVPYAIMDRTRAMLPMIKDSSIKVQISDGHFALGPTVITHPEIKIRLIESRIAELPIDAPLSLALALATKYTHEELEDSGLAKRVLEAQVEAAKLIDGAAKLLEPLGITREEIQLLVSRQMTGKFGQDEVPGA